MRILLILIFTGISLHADKRFAEDIKPFLNTYCADCHNNKKQKGKVNLDTLEGFKAELDAVELWQEIYTQLEEKEMPPEDEKQPSEAEKLKVMMWISSQTESKKEEMKKAAFTHMRRLNRNEYDNTIRDLLKINTDLQNPSRNFPADDTFDNLKNNGKALQVSSFHMAAYVEAAEESINNAVRFGKKPEVKSNTYLPPYSKSNNVLKAARALGKDKFMDLVEQRSFTFHPNQQSGVPVSGYYKVTARVQARNRVHELGKGFPMPQDQPLRASIVLSDPKTGDANYLTSSDRTSQEFELPDQKVVEISGKYWLKKGYTAKIGFPNSVPRFKPAKAKIDKKKYKEFFKTSGAYANFYNSQKLMQDHGPVVRVFEVKIEGPFYDEWPIKSHQNLFGTKTLEEVNPEEAVDSLAAKAYRRPIGAGDTAAIKKMMKALTESGYTKEEAVKAGLAAVISSPQFFYLQEQQGNLDNWALACRLSYFLWSTMPDKELAAVAKSGQLSNPQELEKQVLRMIQNPKIDNFINSFVDAWLELDKLGSMPPDPKTSRVYYHQNLENSGRQETIQFMKDLLTNNGNIANFLNSDYTFMNKGLAVFYKRSDAAEFKENEYRKVKISDKRRGGLLGQMSILTATANGVDTSPIIRGMWVLKNFLGEHPHAPANVPAVEPDVRGAKTLRQLLDKHKSDKNCYACHKDIDPPGFALENFDHIGQWREVYNEHLSESESRKKGIEIKQKVDSTGEMSDGKKFKDIIGFKDILMGKKERFALTLTQKMLAYGTGREIRSFEKPEIKIIAEDSGFKDLLLNVIKSEIFRRK